MTLTSINVPQADDINRVIATVRCVADGSPLTASKLGVVHRQVGYYAHAARILGFLTPKFHLTDKGRALLRSSDPERLIAEQFQETEVYREWVKWTARKGLHDVQAGTASDFLTDYFSSANLPRNQSLTDNADKTGTISRRSKTLQEWHGRLCPYYH